jgi:AraC-like DNA-binding protein
VTDVIDTRELAADERYDAAYETIAANLARVDMAVPRSSGIVLRGTLTHLGDVGHSSISSNVTDVTRKPDGARDVLPPSIFLGIQATGSTLISQGGRDAVLSRGRMVLWETTNPYTLVDPTGIRQHYFRITTAALGLPADAIRAVTAQVLTPDHPIADLALAYFSRLAARPDTFSRADADAVSQPTIELMRSLISTHLGVTSMAKEPLHATLQLRILEYIRVNLADPRLNANQIAAQHHISVRHLYNVLAEGGVSLGDWIRTQRLERCRSELTRPQARSLTIAALARQWGFTNPSSFGRYFREAYGQSPGEWRDAHGR